MFYLVGRYTLLVSVEERSGTSHTSYTDTDSTTATTPGTVSAVKPKRPVVNIYDLKNRIICGTTKKYHLALTDKVAFAVHDGGILYLITSSGSMIRFSEKNTLRKLDVLLVQSNPPMFPLAILLAAEEQLEASEIMKLYKKYGDYLYEDGDFDGAIMQYCHTIGYVPTSSIITKYLEPYRIHNLIVYLEKLHMKGLAASDHVTLLLICYTKIKDQVKINQFLDEVMPSCGMYMNTYCYLLI